MKAAKTFLEDLHCYRESVLAQGFWALQVYRISHCLLASSPARYRRLIKLCYLPAKKLSEIAFGISIPAEATLGRRVIIEHFGNIIIHGGTVIGDDCLIRQGVTLGNRRLSHKFDAPRLGNRVDVGAGAKILGAVTIGDDARIGANAVVLDNVPPGGIAVGVPARIIRRNDSISMDLANSVNSSV